MSKPELNIGLFGLFGGSNFGNEASVIAFAASVMTRVPSADFVCIAAGTSNVHQLYGWKLIAMDSRPVPPIVWKFGPVSLQRVLAGTWRIATEIWRFWDARKVLDSVNVLVIPGTGIFDDFGQGALDMPCHLLRWSAAARMKKVSVHHVSVGAAEVKSFLSRALFSVAARLSTYRSFRDHVSKVHLQRTGFYSPNDPIYPDLAFGLPKSMLPKCNPAAWPPREIGIGVMGYYGWNCSRHLGEMKYSQYLLEMLKFVDWLLDSGYCVRLLTGDSRADSRPVGDIAQAVRVRRPKDAERLISTPIATLQDLLSEIGRSDLVIGSRFHNVVLSFLLGRPVISIGYTDKNDALMKVMGMAEFCQDVESLDAS